MAVKEQRHTKQKNLQQSHKSLKRKRDEGELQGLDESVQNLDPKTFAPELFTALPLSRLTAAGLEASHFKSLTDIQKQSISWALQGYDILGAARTGSGKTLAFLVPVLENLYRKGWTDHDGLGALILLPTRELAIQIFEVLRTIGRNHTFSAGLIIGGKSLQEERDRMGRMNILVCTPGRMLQHLDQTAAFEVGNLQMLVLDEADRILDMGFQSTVDAIVEHVPKQRQTMLFSATQTKKVSDLARLSLNEPKYIAVHESESSATPTALQQNYIVTPLPDKLDFLWSFIRSNLKSKILVFFSSGKQVRFVYEAFRHMQPGISLMHLLGKQKQAARLEVTNKFAASKHSCLFATDVVARGLDFPAVDWVIQFDCPENADTYIHRVGRTARFERNGRAVLFLEPTEEEGMLQRLVQKKVQVERINAKQGKMQSVKEQLQNICFKDAELKHLGQKAFVSYVRSINIQKDKEVFKLDMLPLEEYAAGLGLPGAPRIKLGQGGALSRRKNAPKDIHISSSEDEDTVNEGKTEVSTKVKTKYDRIFERRNQDILAEHYTSLIEDVDGSTKERDLASTDQLDFMKEKGRLLDSVTNESTEPHDDTATHEASRLVTGPAMNALTVDSKRREKLLKSKKKLLKFKERGKKLVYDDDGMAHEIYEMEGEDKFQAQGPSDAQKAAFVGQEQQRLQAVDSMDKAAAKAKRQEKREKRKAKARAAQNEEDGGGVTLAPYEGGDDGDGHSLPDQGDGDLGSLNELENMATGMLS